MIKINDKEIKTWQIALPIIVLAACVLFAFPQVFATDAAFTAIEKILTTLCGIVGAIFVIVGIVKFAISHANEDGPAQQKSILMMATGAILLVLAGMIGGDIISLSAIYGG